MLPAKMLGPLRYRSSFAARLAVRHCATSVQASSDGSLSLQYANGVEQKVTAAQMRDLCMASSSWNDVTNQRKAITVPSPDPSLLPHQVALKDDELRISWSDGHESVHEVERLKRLLRGLDALPQRLYWLGTEINKSNIQIDFDELFSEEGVQKWATVLHERGVVITRGVPPVRASANAIGSLAGAKTNVPMFDLDWDVRMIADGSNDTAYSGEELPPHTDGCYLKSQPEMQMLLCVRPDQHGGGYSGIIDGFKAAARLREQHPWAFEKLSSCPLTFQFEDDNHMTLARRTVIDVDDEGELQGITWNNLDRTCLPADEEHVLALKAWEAQLADPAALLSFKLEAGEMVLFDNKRCLHSRSGGLRSDSVRLLIGNYWSSDNVAGQILRPRPLTENDRRTIEKASTIEVL